MSFAGSVSEALQDVGSNLGNFRQPTLVGFPILSRPRERSWVLSEEALPARWRSRHRAVPTGESRRFRQPSEKPGYDDGALFEHIIRLLVVELDEKRPHVLHEEAVSSIFCSISSRN